MPNIDPKDYNNWLDWFRNWLKDTQENELKQLTEFFDRSGAWMTAAKDLSQEEWELFTNYVKRDLTTFYHNYQRDMESSTYVQGIKEGLWNELAEMTDRSQIEWQELMQDFKHNGNYKTGEWIGMGELVCQNCKHSMSITHTSRIPECPECGHTFFFREALAP